MLILLRITFRNNIIREMARAIGGLCHTDKKSEAIRWVGQHHPRTLLTPVQIEMILGHK